MSYPLEFRICGLNLYFSFDMRRQLVLKLVDQMYFVDSGQERFELQVLHVCSIENAHICLVDDHQVLFHLMCYFVCLTIVSV